MTIGKAATKHWIVAGIIFLVVVLGGTAYWWLNRSSRDGYYGIFLTNGQVYFGTIASENTRKLFLKDIYYIQLKGDANGASSSSDISLLKLGNEVHGPEDSMEINQNNILFIEKLRPDGNVAKAIQTYRQK